MALEPLMVAFLIINRATGVIQVAKARVLEEGITTLLTSQLGTVSHMPPELLALDQKRLSKKVDIYALGT